MSCFNGGNAEKLEEVVVVEDKGDWRDGVGVEGGRKGGERDERVGERRDIVHGDSGVDDDCVVILSYNMAKIRGGKLRYMSF